MVVFGVNFIQIFHIDIIVVSCSIRGTDYNLVECCLLFYIIFFWYSSLFLEWISRQIGLRSISFVFLGSFGGFYLFFFNDTGDWAVIVTFVGTADVIGFTACVIVTVVVMVAFDDLIRNFFNFCPFMGYLGPPLFFVGISRTV